MPGGIRFERSDIDPYRREREPGSGIRSGTVEWTLKVANGPVALKAIKNDLSRYAERGQRGYYRCEPMEARAVAIKYTTLRQDQKRKRRSIPVVPALMLASLLLMLFSGPDAPTTLPAFTLLIATFTWMFYSMLRTTWRRHIKRT